jgi:hypothetical protein
MIPITEFEQIARDKLIDAQCLFEGNRFDGAVYLAGYALEIALKVKLCKNNDLLEFPERKNEADITTKQWLIHSLIVLEQKCCLNLDSNYLVEWSNVKGWDVEGRYKRTQQTQDNANDFLDSVRTLLTIII